MPPIRHEIRPCFSGGGGTLITWRPNYKSSRWHVHLIISTLTSSLKINFISNLAQFLFLKFTNL